MTSLIGADVGTATGDPIASLAHDLPTAQSQAHDPEVSGTNVFVDVGTDPTSDDPVAEDVAALVDSKLPESSETTGSLPVVGDVNAAAIIAAEEQIVESTGSPDQPDVEGTAPVAVGIVPQGEVCESGLPGVDESDLAVGERAVDAVIYSVSGASEDRGIPEAAEGVDATDGAVVGHEAHSSVPDVSEAIAPDLADHSPAVTDSHDAAAVVEAAMAAIEMPQPVVPVAQIVQREQSIQVSVPPGESQTLADPSTNHGATHVEVGVDSVNTSTPHIETIQQESTAEIIDDAVRVTVLHVESTMHPVPMSVEPVQQAAQSAEAPVQETEATVETAVQHSQHEEEIPLQGHQNTLGAAATTTSDMMGVELSPTPTTEQPSEAGVAESTSSVPEESKVKQESGSSSSIVHFPSPNDVLSGRGASVNVHPGNRHFRGLCQERKTDFDAANHATKRRIATEIVRIVTGLEPPGRFLRKTTLNPGQEVWLEVNNEKAIQKACQVMRDLHRPDRIALREIAAAERKRRKTMGDVTHTTTPAKKRKPDDLPASAEAKVPAVTTPKAEADVSLGDTNTSAPVRESFAPTVPKEEPPPSPVEEENVVMADGVPAGCDNGVVPTANDVLAGRGAFVNTHPGNVRFRQLALERKDAFDAGTYADKRALAAEVVRIVRSLEPSGRFLRRAPGAKPARPVAVDSDGTSFLLPPRGLEGPWEELGDEKSVHKACQVMRDLRRPDRVGGADRFLVTSPELLRSSVESSSAVEAAPSTGLSPVDGTMTSVKAEDSGGVVPMETDSAGDGQGADVGAEASSPASVSIVNTGDASHVAVQEAEVAAAAAVAAVDVPLNEHAVASAAAAAAVAAAAVADSPSVSANEAEAAAAAAVAALDGGSSASADATVAAAAAAAAVAVAILPETDVGTAAPVQAMENSRTDVPDGDVVATVSPPQLNASFQETHQTIEAPPPTVTTTADPTATSASV